MQTIYKEIVTSKTGSLIPILQSGKSLESLYNPEKDAERKTQNLNITESFIVILGMGSGIFIDQILSLLPESKIICCEYSTEDISLLLTIPKVQELSNKIQLIPKEDLYNTLVKNYMPALYGNLRVIDQTNYISENQEYAVYLKNEIQNALDTVSKDYSVQAHFGKLWQHNILNNIKQSGERKLKAEAFPVQKTAAILAAGPSLDDKIQELKENRDQYYIISTDTAYSSALRNNIICDAVISLDAQNVSVNHFIHKKNEKTLFIIELSSSPSIIHSLKNQTVLNFTTGHPLSAFLSEKESYPVLNSGSGTVTIAALDFAFHAGFTKLKVFGADFGFTKNKPYAKGTYLDSLYLKDSIRIQNAEMKFTKLMYRTELIERENKKTTEILESYRKSFENYLKSCNTNFFIEQNVYVIKKNNENISKEFSNNPLHRDKVIEKINSENQNLKTALLPFEAYLRRKNPDLSGDTLFNTAIDDLKRYINL